MTGKDILQEEFEKAGMRGYKAEQVDNFLQKVAAYVDDQETEKNDLTYKIKILAEKIEEYKADEENIREALLGAQKLGTSILNEAKSKSESMVREAKTTYDTLMSQAKSSAESLTKDSLQKANADLKDIKHECDRERAALEKMKKEVSSFKASILKQYKTHLDLLTNIPSVTNPPVAVSAPQAAPKEETREAQLPKEEFFPEFKAGYEEGSKPAFFDQDANSEIYTEKTAARAARIIDAPLEAELPKVQTLPSELLTNEKELEDEEAEQTKEFTSDPSLVEEITAELPQAKQHEDEDEGQEKFTINMGTAHQRPNYMEKFGELKFGGFGTDKK